MGNADKDNRHKGESGTEAPNAASQDDRLLFSTENGWVRHCACRDVMILHFLGHWMPLSRGEYRDFHARLIAAVRCPIGQRQLKEGGRFAFRDCKGQNAFMLDASGMEELLWLLDSARFMLDARDAAATGFVEGFAAGFAASAADTEDESWTR